MDAQEEVDMCAGEVGRGAGFLSCNEDDVGAGVTMPAWREKHLLAQRKQKGS